MQTSWRNRMRLQPVRWSKRFFSGPCGRPGWQCGNVGRLIRQAHLLNLTQSGRNLRGTCLCLLFHRFFSAASTGCCIAFGPILVSLQRDD